MKITAMNKFFSFFSVILLGSSLVLWACQSEVAPEFDPSDKGTLQFEFDNVSGTRDLVLNTETYTNAAGEPFTVSMFQYYVSNIKLKKADGTEYVHPQDSSYFLVQEHKRPSQFVKLRNVPAGDYTEVTFTIGVDSLRSTMDISRRFGCLNPTDMSREEGMYWTWNSGYIFVKLEGSSTAAPADPSGNRRFRYHIGGFGGGFGMPAVRTINNVKTVTVKFGRDQAKVRKDATPEVHIVADVLKLFNGATPVSLAQNPTVMFSPFSVNVASNYTKMFEFHHLHNSVK
jgi:hypothetical protein